MEKIIRRVVRFKLDGETHACRIDYSEKMAASEAMELLRFSLPVDAVIVDRLYETTHAVTTAPYDS